MMQEADTTNKGYINERDFLHIIAKQKIDYKEKLEKEASEWLTRGRFYCARRKCRLLWYVKNGEDKGNLP